MYPRIGGRRDRASSRRASNPLALGHDSGLLWRLESNCRDKPEFRRKLTTASHALALRDINHTGVRPNLDREDIPRMPLLPCQ